jgi:hypothetical protein
MITRIIIFFFLVIIGFENCTIYKRANNSLTKCCFFNCESYLLTLNCASENQIGNVTIYLTDKTDTASIKATPIFIKSFEKKESTISLADIKETLIKQVIDIYVKTPNSPWGNYYLIQIKQSDWANGNIVFAGKSER